MITIMSDGDEGQTGLQEITMDSLNNETPKNTENKQQQTFLTNLQSILISSRQTHSMGSSGPSGQGTNDMSTGCSGSSRQGINSTSLKVARVVNLKLGFTELFMI